MLLAGLICLLAAQLLGIAGLRRPGYELLTGIGMLSLATVPFAMVVMLALQL
jgi:hypothetical protein